MDITDSLVALAGAFIGGGITGFFTLKATDKAIRDQNEKERKREEKEIQNLLDALGVEIKTLWDFHMKRVGFMVEDLQDGQALEFYYPLTQDYFTVYNSNAVAIGKVQDCDLSEAIVVCYNKCKKAVDMFKYNNDLLREYRQLQLTCAAPEITADKLGELIYCAKLLKEDHFELKSYVERMLELLEKQQ